MNANERNIRAREFVTDKLDSVSKLDINHFSHAISNFQKISNTLDDLIDVKSMGFRGVVATAITGKYLDESYDPLRNFYGCNPRSIFEKGIFYAFEGRVPCGKSDPLNVAKNVNVLDEEWAKGKRPATAAKAAVEFLRELDRASTKEERLLVDLFFFKLKTYADKVSRIPIALPKETGLSNQLFASKLVRFVNEYPESGTIPQFVIYKLLHQIYDHSSISIVGGDESVFGTNTTSKKPADLWLSINDTPVNLFEVTLKKVDYKRLDDCLQSLKSVGMLDHQVSFICRLPTDVSELDDYKDGTLKYNGKTFNFVHIDDFIRSTTVLLFDSQIKNLQQGLVGFVGDINRPIATKEGWTHIFG